LEIKSFKKIYRSKESQDSPFPTIQTPEKQKMDGKITRL